MVSKTDGGTPPRISRQRRTGGILASTVSLLIQFAVLIVKVRRKECFAYPSHNPFVISISFYVVIPPSSSLFPFHHSSIPSLLLPPLPSLLPPFRHSGESRNPEDHLKRPFVSIPASRRNGTLSIGVTSNLARRIEQHREDVVAGFTRRYGVHTLVWHEGQATMESAIAREKALKRWRRAWKVESIEKRNPLWRDLSAKVV